MSSLDCHQLRRRANLLAVLLLPLVGCASSPTRIAPGSTADPVWAIRCDTLRGPDRFRLAEGRAAALKKVRGLKPDLVQTINAEDETVVYYGRYRRKYDTGKERARYTPDARRDLALIRSLSITVEGRNVWPFIYATLEELPTGRPQNPAWDLNQAEGYWSLHVAVFFNEGPITNRRYLADEYCRELRAQGEQAYYHHGPVRSSVYVGLFPKEAVRSIRDTDPLTGAVTFRNKIVDERLLELQRRFPRSRCNARDFSEVIRDPRTGEITARIPFQSFLVKVPRAARAEGGAGGSE